MTAATIISIILALLKGVNMLFQYGQEQRWISEGQAKEVAKALAQNLRMTNYAKHAMEESTSMSDSELAQRLRDLEPGDTDSK